MPAGIFKRPVPRRFTVTTTNIGTSLVPLTVTGAFKKGWVHQIIGSITGGDGTQLRVKLREGASGRTLLEYPLMTAPLNFADGQIFYQLADGDSLTVEVASDDAGNTTDVSLEITLQRV